MSSLWQQRLLAVKMACSRWESMVLCLRDALGMDASRVPLPPQHALRAAADWILRAAQQGGGGVSARYETYTGRWWPPYRETTGYIITSLLDVSRRLQDPHYSQVADALGTWLIQNMRSDGSVAGESLPDQGQRPIVFDTGQVLEGLVSLWRHGHRDDVAAAARGAARWLVSVQDGDGAWRKFVYNDVPHAYKARVAWILAEYGTAFGDSAAIDSANRFFDCLQGWRKPNGFFEYSGFDLTSTVWTHTIAYTLEGMVRAAEVLQRVDVVEQALQAADRMAELFQRYKRLPGGLDENWNVTAPEVCLTGLAQMAIVWFLLGRKTNQIRYTRTAMDACEVLLRRQEPASAPPCRAGALPGSWPIWGSYLRLAYPNWAAKFFIDAMGLYADELTRFGQEATRTLTPPQRI